MHVTQILAAMNHRIITTSRHAEQAQATAAGLNKTLGMAGSLSKPSSVVDRLARPTVASGARHLWDLVDADELRAQLLELSVLTNVSARR